MYSRYTMDNINNEIEELKQEEVVVKPEQTSLWSGNKPLFVFRFESGNLSKSKYVVTARTKEDALNKLSESLGQDDISHLKFESMTEWKVETDSSKTE
jgi:hypothetical protein